MNETVAQSKDLILSWYYSGMTALAGLLIGLVADFILKRYVHRLAKKTAWEGDEMIINLIAARTPLWGLLGGIIIALPFTPLGPKVILWLHKASAVGLILSVTSVGANIAANLVALSAGEIAAASTTIFRLLSKVGVWGIGLTVMMNQLGVSIAPILTALGVGGLAVALALQDTLGNLFAGIHIILSRQVHVGDYIKLDTGAEGTVADINWRNTTIRAQANNLVVIPNSKLASAIVTNFQMPEPEQSLVIPVGVAYGSDLAKVEQVTIEVARDVQRSVEGAIPEFEPFIRYHTLGESAVQLSTILRIRSFDAQFIVKHEFIRRLHDRYRAEGIEIPFPQRVVRIERE